MRVRVVSLTTMALCFAAGGAAAQQVSSANPDSLRPPQVLVRSPAEADRGLAQLIIGDLLWSVRVGDTLVIGRLLDEGAVPVGEIDSSGCSSLGAAVLGWLGGKTRVGGDASSTDVALALGAMEVRPIVEGDSLALADVTIVVRRKTNVRRVAITVVVRRNGNELRIARIEGLHAAMCALAKQ